MTWTPLGCGPPPAASHRYSGRCLLERALPTWRDRPCGFSALLSGRSPPYQVAILRSPKMKAWGQVSRAGAVDGLSPWQRGRCGQAEAQVPCFAGGSGTLGPDATRFTPSPSLVYHVWDIRHAIRGRLGRGCNLGSRYADASDLFPRPDGTRRANPAPRLGRSSPTCLRPLQNGIRDRAPQCRRAGWASRRLFPPLRPAKALQATRLREPAPLVGSLPPRPSRPTARRLAPRGGSTGAASRHAPAALAAIQVPAPVVGAAPHWGPPTPRSPENACLDQASASRFGLWKSRAPQRNDRALRPPLSMCADTNLLRLAVASRRV